jgi:hypothetical protein
MADQVALYCQQYIEKQFERRELFEMLAASFDIDSCLYPGSFVHCTPSFYFRECCYIDTDSRAVRFFKSATVRGYIADQAVYGREPEIRFHQQDYEHEVPEEDESFDLLLSLYAGFISPSCRRYLKLGGLLVVNNSHGDASMASLDDAFRFVGAIQCRNGLCRLDTADLDSYFVPTRELDLTPAFLRRMKRGVAYTRQATCYVFERLF